MANVSSSNGIEKYPLLRFNGYNNPWMTQKLGDLGTFIKGAPLSKADISNEGNPFILYGELYTTYSEVTHSVKRKTDKTVEQQFYSKIGDVIMPTSGETPEDIATASCIMLPDVILAGDLLIYRTEQIDGRFVSYAIKNKVNKQISSVAQGKSVVHVRADELAKICITFPALDEQKKILNLLELLDTRIATQQSLIETLKKYKRGVVKTLLDPKQNQRKGVIWTTDTIGKLGTFIKGAALSKADISDFGTPFVLYGELYTTYKEVVRSIARTTQASVDDVYFSKVGDVVIPTSGETPEEISTASCIMVPNVILAGDLNIYRSTIVDGRIMSYLLNHIVNAQIARVAQGKSVVHVQASEVGKISITYPDHNEQERIAQILELIDNRIAVSEKALISMQMMKKAFLQQLFI